MNSILLYPFIPLAGVLQAAIDHRGWSGCPFTRPAGAASPAPL